MVDTLKIGENTFNIMSRRPLAHGGNQKVEEVIIAPSIEIDGEKYDNILLKKNFCNELIDLQSLTVFQELITRKIPTVKFLIEATINEKPILVTENLNKRYKDTIYVSSNYHSENYLIRALISSLQNKPMPLLENNSNSMEYFLSKNKLSDIKNIDDVITQGNLIAEKCYRNNIFFPEDAIFFGVNLINQTIDDILLVDYGSVLLNGCCDKIVNFEAIRTAIEEFKMNFVH